MKLLSNLVLLADLGEKLVEINKTLFIVILNQDKINKKTWQKNYDKVQHLQVDHILSFSLSLYPKLPVLFLKPEQLQFASIKTYSNKF